MLAVNDFYGSNRDRDFMGTILIVDDSPTALHTMRSLLESYGHHVVTAQDGLSAFATLQTVTPDLIILDIGLPYINGIDLCAALNGNPNFSSIPIMIVTGSNKNIDARLAQRYGAIGYFNKPVDETELLKAVHDCVPAPIPAGSRG